MCREVHTWNLSMSYGPNTWEEGLSTLTTIPIVKHRFFFDGKADFHDYIHLCYGWPLDSLPFIFPCGKWFTVDHAQIFKLSGLIYMWHDDTHVGSDSQWTMPRSANYPVNPHATWWYNQFPRFVHEKSLQWCWSWAKVATSNREIFQLWYCQHWPKCQSGHSFEGVLNPQQKRTLWHEGVLSPRAKLYVQAHQVSIWLEGDKKREHGEQINEVEQIGPSHCLFSPFTVPWGRRLLW